MTMEEMATKLEALEKKVQNLDDVNEIQKLMARYECYHSASNYEATKKLFIDVPGVRAEFADAVYYGYENTMKVFDFCAQGESDLTGRLYEHLLCTSSVEVAADGKTAVGIWKTIGPETAMGPDGKQMSCWALTNYHHDFIKVDGKWYFWHYRVLLNCMIPYDSKGWTDVPFYDFFPAVKSEAGVDQYGDGFGPDACKLVKPFTLETADCDIHNGFPFAPDPYETFTPEMDKIANLIEDWDGHSPGVVGRVMPD